MSRWPINRFNAACRQAFTLIELLVVIAILALLVSILVPSLQQARQMALAAKCMVNLKSCGEGFMVYAHDNNGYLFPAQMPGDGKPFNHETWQCILAAIQVKPHDDPPSWLAPRAYVDPGAVHCPVGWNGDVQDFDHGLYGYNDASGYPIGKYQPGYFRLYDAISPGQMYLLCDSPFQVYYFTADFRHMNKNNILWMDGHVKLTGQNYSPWAAVYGYGIPCPKAARPVYNGDPCPYPLDN